MKAEKSEAEIKLDSFGCVSELRFDKNKLRAVAKMENPEIRRLLDALLDSERKRKKPDTQRIESLEFLKKSYGILSSAHFNIELEMIIAAGVSVLLQPNIKDKMI